MTARSDARTQAHGRLPLGVLIAALLAAVAISVMVTTQDLAHRPAAIPVGPVDVGLAMLFLVGWILMSTAMMLPTALPLVALLERTGGSPCALMGALAFLLVWFSLGPAIWLASSTVAGFWGPETTEAARLGGAALIIAGVYQLSPLARRCLNACRHPFGFLARHWGTTGKHLVDAATIGAAYGLSCVGCCAALMVVMVLVGCTDLAWMLTLGLVMAFQKHAPFGRHLVLPVGITLIGAGLAITGGLLDWSAGIERSSGLAIDSSLCIAGTSP